MERREKYLEKVGLIKRQTTKKSACTRGYKACFGVEELPKKPKREFEKR
jgi:hypothetical protein